MKIERTKNATRNILFGSMLKIYQIVIPFLMRTIMIYALGMEYLGLNGLFSSVLQVLNLAELGAGTAMVYSMYKPITEDDEDTICKLLNLYKKYYFLIGVVIAILAITLIPFLPHLIKGKVPDNINIYLIYVLNVAMTVSSYWMYAYKNSILSAYQRIDITSKIYLFVNTIQYMLQIITIVAFKNYYLYLIIAVLSQIGLNLVISYIVNKKYPNLKPKGKLDDNIKEDIDHRIRGLFTAKIGATVVNSVDTLVISGFLGLSILAMYQNYYFIMSSVIGLITVIYNASLAGVGNSLIIESIEKNYQDFRKLSFMINWFITICTCCFICLYQPFMELWVGERYMFDISVVVLLCIYFYLVVIQQFIGMYKDAAGIWYADRWRPLIAAAVNLILNLSFVGKYGIYAIILSTIASYIFVAMPWMLYNLFKYVFRKSLKMYCITMITNIINATCIALVCYAVCNLIHISNNILKLIIYGLICMVLPNILMYILNRKKNEYNLMIDMINYVSNYKFCRILEVIKSKKII